MPLSHEGVSVFPYSLETVHTVRFSTYRQASTETVFW
jgi:hypothetical protein